MFKIISSFTRTDTDQEFFNDIYSSYDIVNELHRNAEKIPGFLGIDETVYRDEFRCDKALCFDSEESFNLFVAQNYELLIKRSQLIEDYCQSTGQVYKYYMLK